MKNLSLVLKFRGNIVFGVQKKNWTTWCIHNQSEGWQFAQLTIRSGKEVTGFISFMYISQGNISQNLGNFL